MSAKLRLFRLGLNVLRRYIKASCYKHGLDLDFRTGPGFPEIFSVTTVENGSRSRREYSAATSLNMINLKKQYTHLRKATSLLLKAMKNPANLVYQRFSLCELDNTWIKINPLVVLKNYNIMCQRSRQLRRQSFIHNITVLAQRLIILMYCPISYVIVNSKATLYIFPHRRTGKLSHVSHNYETQT